MSSTEFTIYDYIYGITRVGYTPKPISVIENDFKSLAQQMFGPQVDLTQQSVLWKILQLPATEQARLWLQSENNFYSQFISTASGSALELLLTAFGVEKKPALKAVVELTIYKNTSSQVTVPQGSLFQTLDDIIFATNEEITIPNGDPSTTTGLVLSTALEGGIEGNVASGLIILPTNTISGVDRSNNVLEATGGEDIEEDDAYRKRGLLYPRATWTAAAIRTAALNVQGIESVKIIELDYSYQCFVVPTVAPLDPSIESAVDESIEAVTPITVEYEIIEAEIVNINITSNVVLSNFIDEATAESDARLEIQEYISTLGIDDDVIKAKITQAIMDVNGINNAYNIVLQGNPIAEQHTFETGTDIYPLDYETGDAVVVITGTKDSLPYTFATPGDYVLDPSPAEIDWTGGANKPDNGTVFYVTYTYPANSIGDVVILQENIARLGTLDFTVV